MLTMWRYVQTAAWTSIWTTTWTTPAYIFTVVRTAAVCLGLGHKVTKDCSSIKASQVELFMAFFDYGVEIILRLKTRQKYLWIFWFLGYSSPLSALRIRRWLLVNHVSPLASVSAEGWPATNRNLFIVELSLHRVLEIYIIWATALIWCMIYALFLAWPPRCLVE